MSEKSLKRRLKFDIPNCACRHYDGLSGCTRDEEFHTCCAEECTLDEVFWKRRTDCKVCDGHGFTVDSEGHAHKCYKCKV